MDYVARERLKLIGHTSVLVGEPAVEFERDNEIVAKGTVSRVFVVDVVAFDWNCPKRITPRYAREDVDEIVKPLQERIRELESKLEKLE